MKLSEFLVQAGGTADETLKPHIENMARNIAAVKGVKVGITKTGLLRVTTPSDADVPVAIRMGSSGEIEVVPDEVKREVRLNRFVSKYNRMCVYDGPPEVEYSTYQDIAPLDKKAIQKLNAFLGTAWQELRNYTHLFDLAIVSGDELMTAYRAIPTCMTGHIALRNLYAKHPSKIRLAIVKRKGTNDLVARALLWTLDNDRYFLDRIYPTNNGRHMQFLKHMAQENGWIRRIEKEQLMCTLTPENGDDHIQARRMPYFDTMRSCKGVLKEGKVVELTLSNLQAGTDLTSRADGWVSCYDNNPFHL